MADKKVLIVEDDKFLREMLSQKLIEQGIHVEASIDGKSAVEKMKTYVPDLLLLDLLLPDLDGFEVLKSIKGNSAFSNMITLVLSNLDKVEDVKKAKELGAKDFMIKSNYTSNEIVAKTKENLGM